MDIAGLAVGEAHERIGDVSMHSRGEHRPALEAVQDAHQPSLSAVVFPSVLWHECPSGLLLSGVALVSAHTWLMAASVDTPAQPARTTADNAAVAMRIAIRTVPEILLAGSHLVGATRRAGRRAAPRLVCTDRSSSLIRSHASSRSAPRSPKLCPAMCFEISSRTPTPRMCTAASPGACLLRTYRYR